MNTLRHAFPANRGTEDAQNDEIRIALHPLADTSFELRIRDNGVGRPADFDLHTLKTLGFKLINSIINHQLHGALELVRQEPGTEVIVKLNPPGYKPRIVNREAYREAYREA